MNTRKRHGSRNTEQGVYLGPSQTQVLPPFASATSRAPSAPPPPRQDTMSCQDRTQEFLSACKSLQSRQVSVTVGGGGACMGCIVRPCRLLAVSCVSPQWVDLGSCLELSDRDLCASRHVNPRQKDVLGHLFAEGQRLVGVQLGDLIHPSQT